MLLYFVPGNATAPPAELAYAFERANVSRTQTLAGPHGTGEGIVFSMRRDTRVRFAPNDQEWKRVPNTPYFVGKWNDETLTPDGLARPEMRDGHWVELGDGSRWLCAIARGFDVDSERFHTPLPRALQFDPESNAWIPGPVLKPYRRLLELTNAFMGASYTAQCEGLPDFSFPEINELAVLGLTANYRVSSVELSFLTDGYSIEVRNRLIDAITDGPTLLAWTAKKNGPASVGSDT